MRKHRQQMKANEAAALDSFVREIAKNVITNHAAERMAQKGVTAREIELCLQHGEAIEIHNDEGDSRLRAVVRFAYGRPKVAVCVVVELLTGNIVTTWKNAGNDNHSTLNLYAYQWKANVCNLLASITR